MSDLKTKLFSSAKPQVEETISLTINKIVTTRNPERVLLKCSEGDVFVFTNVFPKGVVPNINKPLKIEALIAEKGEYTNVISISYDAEDLGKFGMVSSFNNPVVL